MKKIIISGGGTGGHIFPAISIANAIKRLDNDVDILFVGAEGKMEMEKVPKAGYKIIGLPVRGLQRKLSLQNIKVLYNLFLSLRKAKKIVKEFKPDAVVCVGGYASGPIGRVASNLGIPLLLQEQNSYAGVTNKILSKKASKICVAYDNMDKFFNKSSILITGNPVRKDLLISQNLRSEGIKFYDLELNKKTILITGGSLGAGTLNKSIVGSLKELERHSDIQILWQCGSYYYDTLHKELEGRLPENVKMFAFLERMDLAYALADVVVARAGAGTISELCLLGKASILVPSPNVAEDHQTKNAMALVNKDAAIMLKDSDSETKLVKTMLALIGNPASCSNLKYNIAKLGIADSDTIIAKELLSLIKAK